MKLRAQWPGIEILMGALLLILSFQNCDGGYKGDLEVMSDGSSVLSSMDVSAPEDCGDALEGDTWYYNRGVEDVPQACPSGSTGTSVKHVMMQDQYVCRSGRAVGTGISRQGDIVGQDINCTSTGPGGDLPPGGTISCGAHKPGDKWYVDSGSTYEVPQSCPHGGNLVYIYALEVEKLCADGVVTNTGKSFSNRLLKGTTGACNGATPTPTPPPGTTPTPPPVGTIIQQVWVALQTKGSLTPEAVCSNFSNQQHLTFVPMPLGYTRCASGENRGGATDVVVHTYTVHVGGHDGDYQTRTNYNCYSPGQTRDWDDTDLVTHYLCVRYQ